MAQFEIPSQIKLRVVTPERSVVSEEVDEVVLPGVEGYLGALPGHTPLLTSLRIGEIKYRSAGAWKYLAVSWGFVEILPDRVTVLADMAERAEEIDVEAARQAKEQAEKKQKNPDADFLQVELALQQALIRLQVAAKAAPLP